MDKTRSLNNLPAAFTMETKMEEMSKAQEMRDIAEAYRTSELVKQYKSILDQIEQTAKLGCFVIRLNVPSYHELKDIFERNGFKIECMRSNNNDVTIQISW